MDLGKHILHFLLELTLQLNSFFLLGKKYLVLKLTLIENAKCGFTSPCLFFNF